MTVDRDFAGVIRGCADRPEPGVWITPEMIAAYERLHRLGHAHSVEVWHEGQLAGGLYGVAVGGLFAGESMFTRVRDASKVALVHVMDRLRERGYRLFDVQFLNDHTESLGAVEIPRREYLAAAAAGAGVPGGVRVSRLGPDGSAGGTRRLPGVPARRSAAPPAPPPGRARPQTLSSSPQGRQGLASAASACWRPG